MKQIVLTRSNSKNKKFKVVITNETKKRTIHFGDINFSDYTIHKDKQRQLLYINRHSKNENWADPFTAGFWSYHILWSSPSLKDAIEDVKKKLKNYDFIVNI
jgi:rhamnogalacturonyl hydrolase YesR